ncbi:MAG: hypothetical protein JWO47_1103, partial [Candidatus Saccharibacteria bacterium]|nr:hypothetical protein [Candidatus Saccharibacteria bacterium]
MSEYLTHEPINPLPAVEPEIQLSEREQLIRQDYEEYGDILNNPDFQTLVVELESDLNTEGDWSDFEVISKFDVGIWNADW